MKGQENKYRYKKKERRRDKRVAIKVSKGNNVVIFIHYTVITCRNKRYPKRDPKSSNKNRKQRKLSCASDHESESLTLTDAS